MERKVIRHGNHVLNNDTDGYIYSYNTTEGYTFASHLHSCYEFIHIIHGNLLYTVEGSDYMLSDGDFIMTKPAELHSFSFPKKCKYEREFFHIYPGFLSMFPELLEQLDNRESGYFNRFPAEVVTRYGIDKIFKGIEENCANRTPETDFISFTYALQLVTRVNQVLKAEQPEKQEVITNRLASRVSDYIDTHYAESITIDSIASSMFVSQSYLSRVFKKETGITVKAYLNMRRVTAAKNLIMEGQQITHSYSSCGYNDYSTFFRAFVKYAGMTPEEFRKKHNKK